MDYGENPISSLIMLLLIDGSTNLPIPKVTSSIVCQLAGWNTEDTPVVCDYPDAPQDFLVHHQEEVLRLILEFM